MEKPEEKYETIVFVNGELKKEIVIENTFRKKEIKAILIARRYDVDDKVIDEIRTAFLDVALTYYNSW